MSDGHSTHFRDLEQAVCNRDRTTREAAVEELLARAEKEPGIRGDVLAIFQRALTQTDDSLVAFQALQGIGRIAGSEAAADSLSDFLSRAPANTAASLALRIHSPAYEMPLIRTLAQRPEPQVRVAVTRALGRLQTPGVLSTLVGYLDSSELRPHVIEALRELNDPQAIPYLQPMLADQTDAWPIDNHGPMLRVCDLAEEAIQNLQTEPPAVEIESSDGKPKPQPTETGTSPRRLHFVAFVPLIVALLELPWVAVVLFVIYLKTGQIASNEQGIHQLDLIAGLPPAVGLVIAALAVAFGRIRRRVEWICLILGCIGCGIFLFSFGWEFFH
jgi:hypothetical protein